MGKKFTITEEEKKEIKKLYKEQDDSSIKPLGDQDGSSENKPSEPQKPKSKLVGMTANVFTDMEEKTMKGLLTIVSVEPDERISSKVIEWEEKTFLNLFGTKKKSYTAPAEVRNKFKVDISGTEGILWFSCGSWYLNFQSGNSHEIIFSDNLMKAIQFLKCDRVGNTSTLNPFDKRDLPKADFNKKMSKKDLKNLQESKKKIKITESQLLRMIKNNLKK
jgi:hypothetical protein